MSSKATRPKAPCAIRKASDMLRLKRFRFPAVDDIRAYGLDATFEARELQSVRRNMANAVSCAKPQGLGEPRVAYRKSEEA